MSQGNTSQRLRPFKPLRFGRYTLLMPLSTGGMGEIFLARLEGSHGFDKLCVIKKILPHLAKDQDFVSRFVDEARILVKLQHGNIAQVLDMGVHRAAGSEDEPYIALEFVDGKDLRKVLSRMRDRQLPLPLSFVLSVVTRMLDALAYAHRKRGDDDKELNLVHRDVSPQNILISYEGEVKVIDFGLAKSALSLSKTNPSIVMGKFMYMAPEQARHKTVDRRSDVYAVGLCLWELVTGKNPFEDIPSGELMGKVGNPSIPPLNTVEPLCPQALSDAAAKALAPDPAQRYQAAEEFRGTLQTILQQIDPQAGAESTSRFMRDAFAAEYQAERRMLNTVKEQAKALGGDGVGGRTALAADDPGEPAPAAEETLQNAPSPFASRPTPIATPVDAANALKMDDETPAASRLGLQPEALSFQPTRKPAGSGNHKAHKSSEVHEKETMPSIQLKTDSQTVPLPPQPAPPPSAPPAAAKQPIRARVLAKSFDNDATEAATPAIAEPEPLPSIVVDGLPSEPVRTELEMPAATIPLPSPSAPRASKAALPAQDGKKPAKNGKPEKPEKAEKAEKSEEKPEKPQKPKTTKETFKETFKETKDLREAKEQLKVDKPEQTGERPMPKVKAPAPPPAPQRTDTAILERVPDKPSPGIPVAKKKGTNAIWFAVPIIALLGVAGVIAFDVYMDSKKQQTAEVEEAETVPADEPDDQNAEQRAAPKPEPESDEPAPKEAPKETPKKKSPPAPAKVAKAPASPGEGAMRALQGDFDKLVDESVQRKFKLQLHALEGQVEDKGSDPAFVKKVQDLHEQVKTALAKQQ